MQDIFHYQQFTVHQEHAGMKVGTDSDLLGTLSAGGKRILDIGTGTGVLSLMLAQRCPDARITAIEIDDNAVMDARRNFAESPFAERITLHHTSFQQYLQWAREQGEMPVFDSVVCNPPYFHRSMECPTESRTRARHTSSLPFPVLVQGAFDLLCPGGVFSVCIPPEVLSTFQCECVMDGFALQDQYAVRSLPDSLPKRYVLVHRKGSPVAVHRHEYCMRNADHSVSDWYKTLMKDFLVPFKV